MWYLSELDGLARFVTTLTVKYENTTGNIRRKCAWHHNWSAASGVSGVYTVMNWF